MLQEKYDDDLLEQGKRRTTLKNYMHIYLSKRFGIQVRSLAISSGCEISTVGNGG